jgi:hypothetical protein
LSAAEEHGSSIMRVVRTFVLAALMATTGWTSSRAAERVDLLLVLAADISRSVDEVKFQLQRSGYAVAFSDARVIEAIRSGLNGRIAGKPVIGKLIKGAQGLNQNSRLE